MRVDESALIHRASGTDRAVFTVHVRMLVVEDEPDLAAAVATGLRGEGFDVDVVGDGLDALCACASSTTRSSCSTSCCPA